MTHPPIENLQDIAFIWDMDGTLLDTYEAHYQIWKEALHGSAPCFNREVFTRNFGRTNEESVPKYFGYPIPEADARELIDRKEALFVQRLADLVTPFEGVTNWLAYLHQAGCKMAIASSAPMNNLVPMVDIFGLRPYFQHILSGVGMPSKPAPDVFLAAADLLGVSPATAVVFEDSLAGLQGAQAAGMLRVAKAGHIELSEEDADFIVADYLGDPAKFFDRVLFRLTN